MRSDIFSMRTYLIRRLEIILCVTAAVVISALTIGCPIKFLFGIPCAGCGMTRAVEALFAFDLSAAFYYHPLWPVLPLLILYFMTDELLPRRMSRVAAAVFAVLFIGVYFYRIIFTDNVVVSIDIDGGAVIKFIKLIFSGGN